MTDFTKPQEREFTGVWLPAEILTDGKLKPVDRILYAEIASFGNKGCWKKSTELQEICGVKDRAFQSACKRLEDNGYITQKRQFGRIFRTSTMTFKHQSQNSSDEQRYNSSDEQAQNSSVHIDNTQEHTQDNTSNVEIQSIYDFFISSFNKNPNQYKLTRSRKQKISARLKDAGADMLMRAIKNTSLSEFHNGDNERGWVADLDFIIRSYEQVERLSNINLAKKQSDGFIDINEEEGRITGGF